MGIARERWANRECRSEDGVLLATDQFLPLSGTPGAGYRPGPTELLSEVLSRGAGEWIEVDPLCRCRDETSGVMVEAGGGPIEAEGFVAVTDLHTGELIWALHLCDSEAFTAVSVVGAEVIAVAEEYPSRNEFRIPLGEPHRLRASARYEP